MAELNGNYLRPLLQLPKQELVAYLTQHKYAWREDSSNQQRDYTRNIVRLDLVPLMSSLAGGDIALQRRLFGLAEQSQDMLHIIQPKVLELAKQVKRLCFAGYHALILPENTTTLKSSSSAGTNNSTAPSTTADAATATTTVPSSSSVSSWSIANEEIRILWHQLLHAWILSTLGIHLEYHSLTAITDLFQRDLKNRKSIAITINHEWNVLRMGNELRLVRRHLCVGIPSSSFSSSANAANMEEYQNIISYLNLNGHVTSGLINYNKSNLQHSNTNDSIDEYYPAEELSTISKQPNLIVDKPIKIQHPPFLRLRAYDVWHRPHISHDRHYQQVHSKRENELISQTASETDSLNEEYHDVGSAIQYTSWKAQVNLSIPISLLQHPLLSFSNDSTQQASSLLYHGLRLRLPQPGDRVRLFNYTKDIKLNHILQSRNIPLEQRDRVILFTIATPAVAEETSNPVSATTATAAPPHQSDRILAIIFNGSRVIYTQDYADIANTRNQEKLIMTLDIEAEY
jgi:hypothetical protein